ncbi:MAG: nuclear transport factor 2 family protein [Verrucomicrobiota bacterium]
MKTIALPAATLTLALAITLGTALADNHKKTAEEEAVLLANAEFYAALNAMFEGNLEPMKAVWSHADDVTYMGPGGGFQVGWTDVLKNWEGQAALKLGGEVEPDQIHVALSDSLAVVHNYEIGTNIADGDARVAVNIRATNVYRLEDGKWKMISHHTDLLPFLQKDVN